MPSGAPQIDLKKVLANAQLPALPQSAIRLLELSQDPTNGPAEFAVPIESDPGLTGQVLRFVNSSYFGFSREISSIKLAITLVGIRTIKNFALWSAVFSLMPNPKCGPFDLKNLWLDSLRRALFARAMGKQLGMKEAEEPFSAALLQDMAIPLLAKEAPGAYNKLLDARKDGRVRLSQLEQHVFGWTHANAGAMIARQWNLPEAFATLIESHLDLDERLKDPTGEAAAVAVGLSALLPSASDSQWGDCDQFVEKFMQAVGTGGPAPSEMLAQIDEEFTEFAPVLKLAVPSKSLVDILGEAAAPTA
jgi:HD-like signal output (HDOD) protein